MSLLSRGERISFGDGAGYVGVVDPGPAPGFDLDGLGPDYEPFLDWLRALNYVRCVLHYGGKRVEFNDPSARRAWADGFTWGRQTLPAPAKS